MDLTIPLALGKSKAFGFRGIVRLSSPSETGHEVLLYRDRFFINKLMNGLMADTNVWILEFEVLYDILRGQKVPYSLALHGFTFSFQGSFMSLMGQVNIVDR